MIEFLVSRVGLPILLGIILGDGSLLINKREVMSIDYSFRYLIHTMVSR